MRTRMLPMAMAAASLLLVAGACSSTDTTTNAGNSSTTAGTTPGTTAPTTKGSTPGTTAKPTETSVADIEAMVAKATLVEAGKLTICSDIPYAPFEFEDDDTGELTGFDVQLVDAMAEEMNLTTDFKTTPFDSIIPALESGSCDVIVSATTITDARSEQVLFTEPYFDADQSLLVTAENKDTYKTLDDLGGKTIGVQAGTTGADYADEYKPEGATVKEYPGADDLFLALTSGEIDAILQDYPVNQYRAFKNPSQFVVNETFATGEQYGMATTKANTNLNEALDASLGNVMAAGTFDEIYATWFGAK